MKNYYLVFALLLTLISPNVFAYTNSDQLKRIFRAGQFIGNNEYGEQCTVYVDKLPAPELDSDFSVTIFDLYGEIFSAYELKDHFNPYGRNDCAYFIKRNPAITHVRNIPEFCGGNLSNSNRSELVAIRQGRYVKMIVSDYWRRFTSSCYVDGIILR